MSKGKEIVEGMAYALWANALAGYILDHETKRGRAPDGPWTDEYDDLTRGAGAVPEAAMQPAMELANLYELANGRTLVEMFHRNHEIVIEGEAIELGLFEYGHELADKARPRSGRQSFFPELQTVRFECSFTGEKLVWDGDIEPITTNPARGPVRAGEPSRFRETFRGHGRATAVKPLPPADAAAREARRHGHGWQPLVPSSASSAPVAPPRKRKR